MNASLLSTERPSRLVPADEITLPLRRSYFSDLIEGLFLRGHDSQCRPIMFTSPETGVGVSFICSYVATELAALGARVMLADAQTLAVLARQPAREALNKAQRVELSSLWVLGPKQAGPHTPEERSQPLSGASVVAALREEFTHVVVDAPALSVSEDAILLATAVHGTVFVVQAGRTAKQELLKAREKFISLGGRVLGSVYNGRRAPSDEGERA